MMKESQVILKGGSLTTAWQGKEGRAAAGLVRMGVTEPPCGTGDHSCCRSCCQALPWRRSGCAVPHPRVVQGGVSSPLHPGKGSYQGHCGNRQKAGSRKSATALLFHLCQSPGPG